MYWNNCNLLDTIFIQLLTFGLYIYIKSINQFQSFKVLAEGSQQFVNKLQSILDQIVPILCDVSDKLTVFS